MRMRSFGQVLCLGVVLATGVVPLPARAAGAAPKWQYLVADTNSRPDLAAPSEGQVERAAETGLMLPAEAKALTQTLNLLAGRGWELLSVVSPEGQAGRLRLVFRRPASARAAMAVSAGAPPSRLVDLDAKELSQRIEVHLAALRGDIERTLAKEIGAGAKCRLTASPMGGGYQVGGEVAIDATAKLVRSSAYRGSEASVLAQRAARAISVLLDSRGDMGPVTISVSIDGKPVASATSFGRLSALGAGVVRSSVGLVDLEAKEAQARTTARVAEIAKAMNPAVAHALGEGLRVTSSDWQMTGPSRAGEQAAGRFVIDATSRLLRGENGYRPTEARALAEQLRPTLERVLKASGHPGWLQYSLEVKGQEVAQGQVAVE